MAESPGLTWPVILAFANLVLSSAIVITAFSLLGFMLTRNLRSEVAQTFSILLACVLIVFSGDIIIPRVATYPEAVLWLRIQWIGIAMVPAAYLHFSDAVLRTTRHFSRRRRLLVLASYAFSAVLVLVALFTDWLVHEGSGVPPISHLAAGPLFSLFVAYFLGTALYGGWNVIRARRRCLTPTSQRRMTYLALSFAAPGVGVFPYLLASGLVQRLDPIAILLMVMAANIWVGTMLVVMAYSVTYLGVLSPDRVIKNDLLFYLLRGPVVGSMVIGIMLGLPRVELILGLPRDTVLVFAVTGAIVLGELAISAAKPWIDRLLYPADREEITWIETLDRRLLTSSDLRQFLSNILIGLCELFRVRDGFVIVQSDRGLRVEVSVGDAEAAHRYAASPEAETSWRRLAARSEDCAAGLSLCAGGDFWLCPLRSQDGEEVLGLLAVKARSPQVDMSDSEATEAEALLAQAAAAMADRQVQVGVFATLQSILPDLERIQEWRSAVRYARPLPAPPEATPTQTAQSQLEATWQQWTKDALSHYWGGPKLTESPLLAQRLVRRRLRVSNDNPTRALRSVLQEAIERQRPPGERRLAAPEWLIYNILEMRFVQGLRILDIARRLSMSESDLYRKQRAAIAALAKTLAEMDAEIAEEENGNGAGVQEPVAATRMGEPGKEEAVR